MIEEILRDVDKTDPAWRIALLRYSIQWGRTPPG